MLNDLCAQQMRDELAFVFSPDILPSGWLGSKHQLTNLPKGNMGGDSVKDGILKGEKSHSECISTPVMLHSEKYLNPEIQL